MPSAEICSNAAALLVIVPSLLQDRQRQKSQMMAQRTAAPTTEFIGRRIFTKPMKWELGSLPRFQSR